MERNYFLVVMLAILMVAVKGRYANTIYPSALGVCALPRKPGPCYARCPRYYYDAAQGKCLLFTYGCCRGNANNFKTKDICQGACKPFVCTRRGCSAPPCLFETCPNYPEATCHQPCPCQSMWLYRGEDVSNSCRDSIF